MKYPSLRTWFSGILLGVTLALTLTLQSSTAACGPNQQSEYCSENYGLLGFPSAVGGRTSEPGAEFPAVDRPLSPTAGRLTYADHKEIEAQARTLLKRNAEFREDISPYHPEAPNFDSLVRKFDDSGEFNAPVPDPDDPTRQISLGARIDLATADLRQARDLYAFLAVYADEPRFRADDDYATTIPSGYAEPLCGSTDKEEPNPPDPAHSGQVLPPVIDWCNFTARLRQSVREAAYIRLIFGQQFAVDALGLRFSTQSPFVGGEAFVRQEVAKLEAAVYQYELAETEMAEALGRAVGSGCYVSDFYSLAEWSVLSRAVAGKEHAQHAIAVRKSYLDDYGATADQRIAAAQATFRTAAVEQHIKLIGLAGLSANPTACVTRSGGELPDGTALTEMVLNMLETREKSREMGEGRNVFGFDARFTPASSYGRPGDSTDPAGLWNQAWAAMEVARSIQRQTEQAERNFDLNQIDLIGAITGVKTNVDQTLYDVVSCDSNELDANELADCVADQISLIAACDVTSDGFDACIQDPRILSGSDLKRTRQDLRAAYLSIAKIDKQIENVKESERYEHERNARVKSAILTNGEWQTGFAVVETLANAVQLTFSKPWGVPEVTVNPGAPVAAAARGWSIMRQAATDAEIEDANSEANVRNILLELIELQADKDIALQQYSSQLTEYEGLAGVAEKALIEAQRQRAYVQQSPANDPSYRIVRDSLRLQLADALDKAARFSYLAAKRAEYEFAARMSASNFAISEIYRARTAYDIELYLSKLRGVTDNLLDEQAAVHPSDFKISVAQHLLGLTDEALGMTGDRARAERTRLFRQWVADRTQTGSDGKPQLVFDFTTSEARNGIFSNVIQQGYDLYWLHKLAGVGEPRPANTGISINLVTEQGEALTYRTVVLTQSGSVHMRTFAGCIFDYRLIAPAVLLGLEWPQNQPAEEVSAVFRAGVNGANGERTSGFRGRSVSATAWQVQVFAGRPQIDLPDMDLQQLTDVELTFSTTYATRSPSNPDPRDCVRIDF
jgi:hypothetical protein